MPIPSDAVPIGNQSSIPEDAIPVVASTIPNDAVPLNPGVMNATPIAPQNGGDPSWWDVAKGFVTNLPSDALNAVKDTATVGEYLTNPIKAGELGVKIAQDPAAAEDQAKQIAGGLLQHYENYLSIPGIKENLMHNPAGVITDVLGLASAITKLGALGKVGEIAGSVNEAGTAAALPADTVPVEAATAAPAAETAAVDTTAPATETAASGAPSAPPAPSPSFVPPSDVPQQVFRGFGRTDQASVYNPMVAPEPIAGSGRYYAFNEDFAKTFGPQIEKAAVSDLVSNPYVIRSDEQWRALTREAGWSAPNPFGADPAKVAAQTRALKDLLQSKGHDGLIVTWDNTLNTDIGPNGGVKLLRNVFGEPQIVSYNEPSLQATAPAAAPAAPAAETAASGAPTGSAGKVWYQGVRAEGGPAQGEAQTSPWWTDNLPVARSYAGPGGYIRAARDLPADAVVTDESGVGIATSGVKGAVKQVPTIGELPFEAPDSAFANLAAPPLPKYAASINLQRINAPEDVLRTINDIAEQNGAFTDARRGVITHDDTIQMAQTLGLTPEQFLKTPIGSTGNAEQLLAARQLFVDQVARVKALNTLADQGNTQAQAAVFAESTRLVGMAKTLSGLATEGGRAMSALRIMVSQTKTADQIVQLAKDSGNLDALIKGIKGLDNAPPEAVSDFIVKSFTAKTKDAVQEAYINALLSGPQTHVTNALSNAITALWSIPEHATAAAISKVTGSGITFGETASRAFGLVEGTMDGVKAFANTIRTEEPSDLFGKIEGHPKAIPGVAGRIVRTPGTLLTAADEFFKSIAYRQEINGQAYRTAVQEKLSGPAFAQRVADLKANPTEEMQAAAHDYAHEQTFTKPIQNEVVKALQREANKRLWLKAIVPFVRTPTNIAKYGAARGPLGVLFKTARDNLAGKNGAVARDTELAKIGFGSAMGAATAYLVHQGLITGQGPSDPKERALKYSAGWQPYSVKIGDNYYSFSRLEPIASILGVWADFSELAQHMGESARDSVASLIVGSIARNFTSKTFLQSVSGLIQAMTDPDRYGQNWVQQMASSVVPTGVAQVARTLDPYLRDAKTILDAVKMRLPGQRETLPVKRDLFGEPIKLEGSLGPDLISPIYMQSTKGNPIAAEMLRLGMAPSKPDRKLMGVQLDAKQYDAYQLVAGKWLQQLSTQLMQKPQWQTLPDDKKKSLLEDVIKLSREKAKAVLLSHDKTLLNTIRTTLAGGQNVLH